MTTPPTVLVATWRDGLFVVVGEIRGHELDDQSVRALASDGHGGALAIVNGRSLRRRSPGGVWRTIATTEWDLACCVAVGDVIYVGTDDARVLRIGANGEFEPLRGFDVVAGRETWYAGSAVIKGRRVGPPLGVRSMTASPDGALVANVHVGGVPRSTDGGGTWQPTIDVDSDVHEVRAHPNRPGIVIAAAAIGLCTSRDGGVTWTVEVEWALRQVVYELLKRVIGQVFRDADDVASATTNFINADQDVRVGASKGIRKTEKIFEDFRFLIVRRLRKWVLVTLEI